jgi:dTDP-4-dehydrorhamnose reductase
VKVLLTGAGGQLGRAVRQAFAAHELVGFPHAELDVAEPAHIRKALDALRPDLVLNAAAFTAVDAAEDAREAAFRVNRDGPGCLAAATAERGIALLHVSTDFVFDGRKAEPYHELDAPGPLSVYGESKLAGEREVQRGNPRHYLVRTAWLYGPVGRNFALTLREVGRKGAVRVVHDQWGSPTYAPHLADALARLVESGSYGLHHLANTGVASRDELARALFEALEMDVRVEPIPTSAWPSRARRPCQSALVSLRQTGIRLPSWQEGVVAWAAALAGPGVA